MSAFRALALSAQQDEASSSSPAKSTPNQSNSGGNSGASGLPCTGDYPSGGADAGSGSNGGQRKRRTAGSVSQMACTPCRTARQRVRKLASSQSSRRTYLSSFSSRKESSTRRRLMCACFSAPSVMGLDQMPVADVLNVNSNVSMSRTPKRTRTI